MNENRVLTTINPCSYAKRRRMYIHRPSPQVVLHSCSRLYRYMNVPIPSGCLLNHSSRGPLTMFLACPLFLLVSSVKSFACSLGRIYVYFGAIHKSVVRNKLWNAIFPCRKKVEMLLVVHVAIFHRILYYERLCIHDTLNCIAIIIYGCLDLDQKAELRPARGSIIFM